MERHFTHKVLNNTLVTLYSRLWLLAVGLLLTPYLLRRLGDTEYGVWVLITVFLSYLGLLDFGFASSFAKHVAEYDARGDREAVNGVVSAGLAVYVGVAIVVIAVAYPTIDTIPGFFSIPGQMEGQARLALGLGLCAFLSGNFLGVYLSVINGLQRMRVSSGIIVAVSAGNAAGSIIVLELGWGIAGLALTLLVAQVAGTLAAVHFAHRLYPTLRWQPASIAIHFPVLLRYGLNLQVSSVAVAVNLHFDKLLISRLLGVSSVALYDIGSRVPAALRAFPGLLLSVLTPATSELAVRAGSAEVYELFARASRYVAVVAFPVFVGAVVAGELIIRAWAGPGYDNSVSVLRIVGLGYLVNVLAGPVSPIVQGIGRPEYQRNSEALSLLVNVMLSIVLTTHYGLDGAAVGTALAMFVASLYYLWSFHRLVDRPLLPFLRTTFFKPAVAVTVAGLVAGLAIAILPPGTGGRAAALSTLLIAGCLFAVSYVAVIVRWRYLEDADLAVLREHLLQRA